MVVVPVVGEFFVPVVVIGDAVIIGAVVGVIVVGNAVVVGAVVGVVIVGDAVVVGAVIGVVVIGDAVIVRAVIGVVIVGNAVVVRAIVGVIIVGDTVIVGAIVGVIIVGDTVVVGTVIGVVVIGDAVIIGAIVGVVVIGDAIVVGAVVRIAVAASGGAAFRLKDGPVHGVHVVFIFHAAGGKFQLKNGGSVVVVKFPVVKNGVCRVYACVGKGDFLSLFQSDVGRRRTVSGIVRVIVVIVNGHNAGGEMQVLHRVLSACGHFLKKCAAGNNGAGLQLNDNVLSAAVYVFDKVTGLIDFYDQVV